MKKNNTFYLPKIETRSTEKDGVRIYSVKGYATTPNHIYPYRTEADATGKPIRSFREYFSDKALENIKRKLKNEKVFVDVEHITATSNSTEFILNQIQDKTGKDFSEEIKHLKNKFKYSELPMFKVEDIKIDDKGLFIEVKGNPFYRDLDEEHRAYFDSVWGSLEQGFINGMSLNFKATETVKINDELTQIDDIDIYGISLTGGASNDMASITEVAMRSLDVRGEKKWQKKRITTLMML